MTTKSYSPRVAEPMPTPRVGEAPHLGASKKPLYVPKSMPSEESCISLEEWLAMSEHFIQTLATIEALCPETKGDCEKLREAAFVKVNQ